VSKWVVWTEESLAINLTSVLRAGAPFFLMSAMPVLSFNLDKVFLKHWTSSAELGFYEVGTRIGNVTSFLLFISLSVFSPLFARAKEQGVTRELFEKINRYLKYVAGLSLVYLLVLLVFGRDILLFWGEDYGKGYVPMILAAASQFVIILTGPVGALLTMCGHQRIYSRILTGSGLTLILMDLLLIPLFGLIGAAMALMISSITMSAFRAFYAWRLEGYSLLINSSSGRVV